MASAPCRCVEVSRKGRELLDECADGREGLLADDWLDRYGNHATAHHFIDGGHSVRDGRHYSPATVAHVCGRNVVPQCQWRWCAQVVAALVACGDGGSHAWTAVTVDASGVVGGAAVAAACDDGGWQPVAAAVALTVFGDNGKRASHAQAADVHHWRR